MATNTLKPKAPVAPRANVPREVVVPEPAPAPAPEKKEKTPRPEKPAKPRSTWSVFSLLDRLTRMDGLFQEGLPVRYLPHLLFLMFLTLLYIGNTHYGNRMNRSIQKLKLETEDLRADYTTLKSDYMEASKQSEVARKVAAYGLVESSSPPFRISVPAGRLDEAELDRLPVLTADSVAARAVADSAAMAAKDSARAPLAPVVEAAHTGDAHGAAASSGNTSTTKKKADTKSTKKKTSKPAARSKPSADKKAKTAKKKAPKSDSR